jgi:hypothetical protein
MADPLPALRAVSLAKTRDLSNLGLVLPRYTVSYRREKTSEAVGSNSAGALKPTANKLSLRIQPVPNSKNWRHL